MVRQQQAGAVEIFEVIGPVLEFINRQAARSFDLSPAMVTFESGSNGQPDGRGEHIKNLQLRTSCRRVRRTVISPMSRREKNIQAFLDLSKGQNWEDAVRFLSYFDFTQLPSGSGSSRKFRHSETNVLLLIHQPHPLPELKRYQRFAVIHAVIDAGFDLSVYGYRDERL